MRLNICNTYLTYSWMFQNCLRRIIIYECCSKSSWTEALLFTNFILRTRFYKRQILEYAFNIQWTNQYNMFTNNNSVTVTNHEGYTIRRLLVVKQWCSWRHDVNEKLHQRHCFWKYSFECSVSPDHIRLFCWSKNESGHLFAQFSVYGSESRPPSALFRIF
jgi:hypothetical protein